MKIDINILTLNRPCELFGLLLSLRTQTFQNWDLFILDDGGGTPLTHYHFLNVLIQRLKIEGHRVVMIRNNQSKGISESRQRLAEFSIEEGNGELILRQDDDTICDPNYLEKLLEVIENGYDLASGVTPPLAGPDWIRNVAYVKPIINRVVLGDNGRFVINGDDCGRLYNSECILPTHHFRSSALYKKEIHEKVSYPDNFTPCGFREEEMFSFNCIRAGFKLGVHTGAIGWHLCCPSGGDRRQEYQKMAVQNQRILNRSTKRWFKKGDFIQEYNDRLSIVDTAESKMRSLHKKSNLIFSREE